MNEFILCSNRVVLPTGLQRAFLFISNGIIREVLPQQPSYDLPLLDAGDNIILPGVIDPHVHINEPGRTEWEGFDTLTKAAIAPRCHEGR